MWGRSTSSSSTRSKRSLYYCLLSSAAAALASSSSQSSFFSSHAAAFIQHHHHHHHHLPRTTPIFVRPLMTMTVSTTTTTQPPTKLLTLLFVHRFHPTTGEKEILLGEKKRGFGIGKWNGFGGKVEPGETIEAAALRELQEESCLTAASAELRGKITFTFKTIPDVLKVHVFEAKEPITGTPTETEEMRPQWYKESEIPFDKMWADDKYWVPLYLEGKRFKALFEFDDETTILRYDLRALEEGEEL